LSPGDNENRMLNIEEGSLLEILDKFKKHVKAQSCNQFAASVCIIFMSFKYDLLSQIGVIIVVRATMIMTVV
jgi:hypothetical protein